MFRLVLMGISFQSHLPERCGSNAFLGLKSCFAANLGSGVGGGDVAKIIRPSVANDLSTIDFAAGAKSHGFLAPTADNLKLFKGLCVYGKEKEIAN